MKAQSGMGSTPFPRTLGLRVSPPLAETPAPPLAGIVPAFDVVKDIRSGFRSGLVLPTVDALAFEHPKETFRRGVIGTTLPPHDFLGH